MLIFWNCKIGSILNEMYFVGYKFVEFDILLFVFIRIIFIIYLCVKFIEFCVR